MNKNIIFCLSELNEEMLKGYYGNNCYEKMVIVDDRATSDSERLAFILSVIPVGTRYAVMTADEAVARYRLSSESVLMITTDANAAARLLSRKAVCQETAAPIASLAQA